MIRHTTFFRVTGLAVLSLIFVLLWSSGWTASAFAVSHSNVLSVLSARYFIVVFALIIMITLLRQWRVVSLHELQHHLMIGVLCHALYLLASVGSFEWGVSATVVAFINSLQPMATTALAVPATGEQVQSRHLKGLFLGIVSVALIVSNSYQVGVTSFALALPFIAMMSITLGTVLQSRREINDQRSAKQRTPLLLVLLVQVTGALIIFLPAAAVTDNLQWNFTATDWVTILWLALVVSLGAYVVLLLLLRHLSAVSVSSLAYLVPPATMLQMYYLFEEPMSLYSILALCIASIAVYMIVTPVQTAATSGLSAEVARQRLYNLREPAAGIDIDPV